MKKLFLLFFILLFSGVSFLAAQTTLEAYGVSPRFADEDDPSDIFDREYSGLLNVGVETQMYLKGSTDTTLVGPAWSVDSQPADSEVDITVFMDMDTSAQVAVFTPDEVGTYVVIFSANGESDTVTINAGTYVGLTDGNCHFCHGATVTNWQGTGHSDMLTRGLNGTLSDHYAGYCISCHVTGFDDMAANGGFDDLGFVYPDSAAIAAYGDTSGHLFDGLYDSLALDFPDAMELANIQCESCHGPASAHVPAGTAGIMSSTLDVKVCSVCHDSGTHHAFPTQWEASGQDATEVTGEGFHGGHAIGAWTARGSRTSCAPCHSGAGFVEWIKNDQEDLEEAPTPTLITCAVCHDPHDATNEHQLRIAEAELGDGTLVTFEDYGTGVLCMNCHRSRRDAVTYSADPDNASSHYGAHHGPEADIFIGTNAPDLGIELPPIGSGVHAMSTENACVDCHMYMEDGHVVDENDDVLLVGGHSFNMNDAEGNDHVESCAPCHGTSIGEAFADKRAYINFTYDHDGDGTDEGLQDEVHGMLEVLKSHLPQDDEGHVAIDDTLLSVEIFKAGYVYFWVEEDRSLGIHNPDYTVALLKGALALLGVTSIDNPVGESPYEFGLSQNYPNPFNPSTKIDYSLSESGHVKLVVYNTLGQKVASLVDRELRAGNHTVDFSAANLSSGVYFYRITVATSANNMAFQEINKMVLMK